MFTSRKSILLIALIALLAVLAVACAAPATQAPAQPAAQQPAAQQPAAQPAANITCDPGVAAVDTSKYKKAGPYTIAFANASVSNSWRVFMVAHLKYQIDQAKAAGKIKDFLYTDAQDKPDKEAADMEDLIAKKPDLIILSAATEDALTPAASKAMKAGIPVVTVDRGVNGNDNFVGYVGADSVKMGATQMAWLAKTLGEKGNIVFLSGIAGASPAEDRLKGAREEMKKYPNMKEVAQAYADWSPVKGKQIMANWLTSIPQIDGVWADSGLQGSGAVEAYQEAKKPFVPLTGEDFNRYLKQWKTLKLQGVGVSFPTWMGGVAVETALKVLNGEPICKVNNVPLTIITSDTLDKYVQMDKPDDFWADIKMPADQIDKYTK